MSQEICEKLKNFIESALTKEELFDLIVLNFPVGLIIVDRQETVIEFNPAAERITGFKKDEVCGRPCHEVLSGLPCRLATARACSDAPSSPKETSRRFVHQEGVILHRDGHEIPVVYTAAPLFKGNCLMGAVTIFRDVSQEKRLEKHRQVVISMFAHDLKGPLSIAGAFLKRLTEGKGGPINEKQRLYAETALKEIARVERYIHAFLDILRMEAGQIPLSRQVQALAPMVQEIVDSLAVKAKEKEIKVVQEVSKDLPEIPFDKTQLQRVLLNLLDNAIKYSPKGSVVTIRVQEKENHILFEIEDQGPGISPQDAPYIFDPFYRAHQEENVEGSGLGLAVVKSIVEAHGGKVWVRSGREGKGANFSFTIPKE